MGRMRLKASAPGSLMLLGEYAVLHDYKALTCALNQRITVELVERHDDKLIIYSDRYGRYQSSLSILQIDPPFQFVLATLDAFTAHLPAGCDIHITSDFSAQIGFGSSAALVAAMLAAINAWAGLSLSPLEMVQHGRDIVRQLQAGRGSGADIAASLYGGIVAYQMSPLTVQTFSCAYPISVCYSGFKTKTAIAIEKIENAFLDQPDRFRALMQSIGECTAVGIDALQQENWQALGEVFTRQQGLMEALGVSLPLLQQMLGKMHAMPNVIGAKISGAGLGDCIIGLGECDPACEPIHGTTYIPVAISQQGVICEEYG